MNDVKIEYVDCSGSVSFRGEKQHDYTRIRTLLAQMLDERNAEVYVEYNGEIVSLDWLLMEDTEAAADAMAQMIVRNKIPTAQEELPFALRRTA